MSLPPQFLDELIARTDIVELINRYVPLKKKGNNFWACCPFHHEKTPSFSVSQDKQFFKCFGCGEGGNAIHFLMKIENLPYIDAVEKLAERAGMEMPQEEDGGKRRFQRRRLLDLNRDAARYYYETLAGPAGGEARAYLAKRGLTPQTIVRFGLGYAGQSWDGLSRAMRSKGYSEQELEEARLAARGKRGSLYDFFRDRIMFPIIDVRGDVVAFGGRILHGDRVDGMLFHALHGVLHRLAHARGLDAQRFPPLHGGQHVFCSLVRGDDQQSVHSFPSICLSGFDIYYTMTCVKFQCPAKFAPRRGHPLPPPRKEPEPVRRPALRIAFLGQLRYTV